MKNTSAEVAEIVRRIAYVSESAYRRDGDERPHNPKSNTLGPIPPGYPTIVAEVTKRIYDLCYCRTYVEPGSLYVQDKNGQQEFLARLHKANVTESSWSSGWRVVEEQGEFVILQADESQKLLARPGDFARAEADGFAKVRMQRGSATVQPGWYHFRGADGLPGGKQAVTRIYWNLCTTGAVPYVRAVTQEFNKARVPFLAKVLADPQGFSRADAGVLYLLSSSWAEARAPLVAVHRRISKYLNANTPMFTRRLAPGVALAESPAVEVDEGFGMHRSRIVAMALWDAHQKGQSEPDRLVEAVLRRLEAERIDPGAPHLNPGSQNGYQIDLQPPVAATLLEVAV